MAPRIPDKGGVSLWDLCQKNLDTLKSAVTQGYWGDVVTRLD